MSFKKYLLISDCYKVFKWKVIRKSVAQSAHVLIMRYSWYSKETSPSRRIQGKDSTNGAFPPGGCKLGTHIENDECHPFPHTADRYSQGSDLRPASCIHDKRNAHDVFRQSSWLLCPWLFLYPVDATFFENATASAFPVVRLRRTG
jgi:hypothetical protein